MSYGGWEVVFFDALPQHSTITLSFRPPPESGCSSKRISGVRDLLFASGVVNASVRNHMRDYHFFIYTMASKSAQTVRMF